MGKLLTAEEILGAQDIKFEDVEVPEWGGTVRVKGASALEMEQYDRSIVSTQVDAGGPKVVSDFTNTKAKLVVRCVVDEQGQRVFRDEQAGALGEKNSAVIELLFRKIRHLSGRSKEAQENLSGNSGAGQKDGSPSTSPATSKSAQ